ncbi:MAG TPA: cell envelope protein [Achromobacter sp.]|nr:cell envelope protein [Achromobacter sp.]
MDIKLPKAVCRAMLVIASFTSSYACAEISLSETRAIAEEGYIYGLPIVMNYAIMYEYAVDKSSSQYKAPFNQIRSLHHVATYKDTAIISPNSDTPYSMMFMDLRTEPIVLSVPAVTKPRYYSVQLIDGSTYNFGYIGSRSTGDEAGDYMVVGPDWKGVMPPGIRKVFRSETQLPFAVFRTQLFNPADMPNVVAIQSGYKAQPLSAYLKQPAPPAAPAIDFPRINNDLAKTDFFTYLGFALQFGPAAPEEVAIRAKLARLGIGADKKFSFEQLSAEQKSAVVQGMQDGHAKVENAIKNLGTKVNGWNIVGAGGDSAFYHGDWLKRAAVAQAGIYANDAAEATYPLTTTLPDGEPLDAGKHNYTITFREGQLPPVNAFWSVTMYDGKTQLLIENSIDRYLINSPMLSTMTKNADGSLTLYLQKTSPGADKENNWLPAPNDLMYLVMRLYWPKTEAPSILPPGNGTWSPPQIVKAM